jgi:hypothetical protein
MSEFVMQKEELAQAAVELQKALIEAREEFEKRGFPISVADVDNALKLLNPILNLCVKKELDEPFYFTAYMGRIMGDHLDFPNIRPHWQRLCDFGRGGLTPLEFSKTDFVKLRLMPRQLRPQSEYQPSEAEQERN